MLLRKSVPGHNFTASDWITVKFCMIVSHVYDIGMTLGKITAHLNITAKTNFFANKHLDFNPQT